MDDLLEITTLGSLRIRRGGEPLSDFGSRKAEALLVYLACSRRPQPREVLADLLWDERSQTQAQGNLRWLLTRLGQQLATYLTVTRTTVAFNLNSPHWLDVVDLEHHLDRARMSHPRGDSLTPVAVQELESGAALYDGPFLHGFYVRNSSGFEEWRVREEGRLQRLLAAALHDLVIYCLERGDYTPGIRHAAHLLQLDPLDEAMQRRMMMLLVSSGQRRAALEQYESYKLLLTGELGTTPDAATTELYDRIREGTFPEATSVALPALTAGETRRRARPQSLPNALTPFVGREEELVELGRYLADPGCRMLTLVGPGGIGKSRLAVEAAMRSSGFPDGVYFASLSATSTPEFLVATIADALQCTLSGSEDPRKQLFDHVRDKNLLLVMDNFEHLMPGAGLLTEMLAFAPNINLMITSREPLNLSAEQLYDVEGLAVPAEHVLERASEYSAVQLFVQRARRVQPRFDLSTDTIPYVVRICRLLEGLPLGIELTAVRVREFSCKEVAQGIEQNIDSLVTTQSDVPARHRSLRAVFDSSWQSLTDEERRVFPCLAVFRGGFDLDAANHVAQASRDVLSQLLGRSLLRLTPSGRYEMHEMVRQYAYTHLDSTPGMREAVETAHADYYSSMAVETFPQLVGAEQVTWLARLEQEHDNLRGALRSSLDRGDAMNALQMGWAMQRFWYFRGHLREGIHWLEGILATPTAQIEIKSVTDNHVGDLVLDLELVLRRARSLNALGVLYQDLGEPERAEAAISESIGLLRMRGDPKLLAGPLNNLALLARDLGDLVRAEALLTESLALYREKAEPQGIALALNNLGKVVLWEGDGERARLLLDESLALFTCLAETRGMALAQTNLAQLARNEDDYRRALSLYKEGLARFHDVGDKRGMAECLEGVAVALDSEACGSAPAGRSPEASEWERIASLCGAAARLRAAVGAKPYSVDKHYLDIRLADARAHLSTELWDKAWRTGENASLAENVTLALGGEGRATRL
jgi:predicted ATPase/DNA-binding SARP family transcriptional activator